MMKQFFVLFAVKIWDFEERLHQRSFSLYQIHKNISKYYNKNIRQNICYFIGNFKNVFVCLGNFGGHRSSRPEQFYKKGFIANFAKFTGKPLCWNLLLEERDQKRKKDMF